MPLIELETYIDAPCERCFDLSRSIDVHILSTKRTKEKAIAGRTSGLIEKDETVTWQARHFGIMQRLTSKITAMQHPVYFVDEMVKGAFKRIYHEHLFDVKGNGTVMIDKFQYEVPFGIAGKLFDKLVLYRYLRRFLIERNNLIKSLAESEQWKLFLPYSKE